MPPRPMTPRIRNEPMRSGVSDMVRRGECSDGQMARCSKSLGAEVRPMDLYQSLFQIAKLLMPADAHKTPELLLRHVLESLGAERGFIVVREHDRFAQRFQVGFDRETLSEDERRFSRSIVKEALDTGQVIQSK